MPFDSHCALVIHASTPSRGGPAQAPKRPRTFLQGIDRRPQRRLDRFALFSQERIHAVRMPDAALEAQAAAFLQLPQRALALWTRETRCPIWQLWTGLFVRLVGSVEAWFA